MTQNTKQLAIPTPKDELVAPGFWREVVAPWVFQQTDAKQLRKADAALAAMEAYYLSLGLKATEWQKSRRVVEIGLGDLLPKEQGKRTDLSHASDKLFDKDDRHRFRQLSNHKDALLAHLESVDGDNVADQVTRAALFRICRDFEAETARKTRRQKTLEPVPGFDIRHCSCAELFASGITPRAVITDPPYSKEFLPVYAELAKAAANVPIVAVMIGQSYLPEIMTTLCTSLRYRWTIAYLTPGVSGHHHHVKINTHWKPVLLFGERPNWINDVASSQHKEKTFHDWGQSESGMAELVEWLTEPGDLLCDPFLGGGTTALVCQKLGRSFVGCDIDEGACKDTLSRLQ